MDKTDLQLIEETLQGSSNNESFGILVERYIQIIYIFVFKLVKNKEDAEDITQEVFIKVWRNLKKYDHKKNLKTWLFSIAKNTTFDKLRKKKSVTFSNLNTIINSNNISDEDIHIEDLIADNEPLQDEIFEKAENINKLKELINNLDDFSKILIHLHIEEEQTFEEISEILNKSINTIKSNYRRLIQKIRKNLT